jgi:hypothetical protein
MKKVLTFLLFLTLNFSLTNMAQAQQTTKNTDLEKHTLYRFEKWTRGD